MTENQVEMKKHQSLDDTASEVLRRRADSLAQETEAKEDTAQMGILLFRLGEEWYSVKVEDVREIYQEYKVTPIPCVPDYVLGVVNIRGEIISVTDAAMIMQLGSVTDEIEVPPAIVIQNDDSVSAIVVDEIGDIVDVPIDGVEPPISIMDRGQAEFIAGSIYVNDRLIGLVNVNRILQPIGQSG